ncbi:MAG: sigma-70 family RNA polymerase sigma factor [Verrucomicrobiales bacterium]|nr:sigma-70 family RNA polymerase sigma factor [Verrucomicrobiales bacterium]
MPHGELTRLYDAHASGLFAFLLNFTRDEGRTRDVMQEVFLRLARRPSLMQGVVDERAFLLRLAHNLAVDASRRTDVRRRAHAALAEEAPDLFVAEPDADSAAVGREISAALGELPPEQRAVVQLKIWEGRTFESVGDVLGIPANTAASRYRYAMEKLRVRLRGLREAIR